MQVLDELGLNLAVGHGANIEQKVGVIAGCLHHILNQLPGGFEMFVVTVVTPRVVHRFAGFKRQSSDFRLAAKTGGVPTRQVLFEHLKIFTVERFQVMIAADHRGRLQAVNQPVRLGQTPVGIRFVPHAIEPDASDLAVTSQ